MRFWLALLIWAIALPANAALLDIQGHPLPKRDYHRIISLAPSNTELLYAIGWGNRLVGVCDSCDYPPAATKKPQVGGAETLDVERMVALKPDLILSVQLNNPALNQVSELTGAPVVVLNSNSVDGIARNADELSEVLGPQGHVFARRFRQAIARIKPYPRKLKMFYLVWDRPLMTAGTGTYIDDLIRLAGGTNVAKVHGYTSYSDEALLMAKPDVLIYSTNQARAAKALQARLHIPIIGLPADLVSRPGPRVPQALRLLVKDLFATFK